MWGVLRGPTSALQMHGLVLVRKLDQLLDCFQLYLKNPFENTFLLTKTFGNFKHRNFFKINYHVFHREAYFSNKILKIIKNIEISDHNCLLEVPIISTGKKK